MAISLTRSYEFSASFAQAEKVSGHNYILKVTWAVEDDSAEKPLDEKVRTALIQKVHSKDLSMNVDFLKGLAITDLSLLKAFWPLIAQVSLPARLELLCLERDKRTQWALTVGSLSVP